MPLDLAMVQGMAAATSVRNGWNADIQLDNLPQRYDGPAMLDDAAVRDRIVTAIRHYLSFFGAADEVQGISLYSLAKALDQLVTTYHATEDVEPSAPDPDGRDLSPRADEAAYAEAVTTRFPDLGLYALADPQDGPNERVGLSMAVGDLAEIAADLAEVLWHFDNSGHNDAVWEFRFGYQSHWGGHLHHVRTYLHSLAAW